MDQVGTVAQAAMVRAQAMARARALAMADPATDPWALTLGPAMVQVGTAPAEAGARLPCCRRPPPRLGSRTPRLRMDQVVLTGAIRVTTTVFNVS